MSVEEKTVQALTVIKQLGLNSVLAVSAYELGPARVHVYDLNELKELDCTEKPLDDGCKQVVTVVDGVELYGTILSKQYLANAPF